MAATPSLPAPLVIGGEHLLRAEFTPATPQALFYSAAERKGMKYYQASLSNVLLLIIIIVPPALIVRFIPFKDKGFARAGFVSLMVFIVMGVLQRPLFVTHGNIKRQVTEVHVDLLFFASIVIFIIFLVLDKFSD